MNFSKYLLTLQEGYLDESVYPETNDIEMPVDESGFEGFGVDKTSAPSEEGFAAARKAADEFVDAPDTELIDVDLNLDIAMPKDTSGFDESFDASCEDGEECVDPNTVPAIPEEDDQFSEPDEEPAVGSISDEELASDDDDIIGESFTGYEDLF